jgi:hypothetical protein
LVVVDLLSLAHRAAGQEWWLGGSAECIAPLEAGRELQVRRRTIRDINFNARLDEFEI